MLQPTSILTASIVVALLFYASAPSLAAALVDGTAAEDRLVDRLAAAAEDVGDSAPGGGLQLRSRDDSPAADSSVRDNSTGAAATTAAPLSTPPRHYHGSGDFGFYVIVGTTTGLALLIVIICAVCWYKYNAVSKHADDEFVDANFTRHESASSHGHPGDGKLALSAQMYHYQHQKQQMLALEKSNGESKRDASDVDSDLENEDADFTVYECPGLANTGEMEVRNPLFKEEIDTAAAASAQPPAPAGGAVGGAAAPAN